jgi:hypothetical protein
MSFHRAAFAVLVAVCAPAMTSLASACCNDGILIASTNGTPIPLAPAPIYVGPWSGKWLGQDSVLARGPAGGCGSCGPRPPLYVVNQGPDYSGAGLMVAFPLYVPYPYPYVSGCGGCGVAAPPLLLRRPPLIHK